MLVLEREPRRSLSHRYGALVISLRIHCEYSLEGFWIRDKYIHKQSVDRRALCRTDIKRTNHCATMKGAVSIMRSTAYRRSRLSSATCSTGASAASCAPQSCKCWRELGARNASSSRSGLRAQESQTAVRTTTGSDHDVRAVTGSCWLPGASIQIPQRRLTSRAARQSLHSNSVEQM